MNVLRQFSLPTPEQRRAFYQAQPIDPIEFAYQVALAGVHFDCEQALDKIGKLFIWERIRLEMAYDRARVWIAILDDPVAFRSLAQWLEENPLDD